MYDTAGFIGMQEKNKSPEIRTTHFSFYYKRSPASSGLHKNGDWKTVILSQMTCKPQSMDIVQLNMLSSFLLFCGFFSLFVLWFAALFSGFRFVFFLCHHNLPLDVKVFINPS